MAVIYFVSNIIESVKCVFERNTQKRLRRLPRSLCPEIVCAVYYWVLKNYCFSSDQSTQRTSKTDNFQRWARYGLFPLILPLKVNTNFLSAMWQQTRARVTYYLIKLSVSEPRALHYTATQRPVFVDRLQDIFCMDLTTWILHHMESFNLVFRN